MDKLKTMYDPVFVVEKEGNYERSYDVYSKLLSDRIIFLKNEVNSSTANSIVAQLLLLEEQDKSEPIKFYINSPGGSITDGFAIIDTMKLINAPVHTFCVGCAASMGALLLSSGDKRCSLPNSWIMIHEPRQTIRSATFTATDQVIDTNLVTRMRDQVVKLLADNCNQDFDKVSKDCERDLWLSPKEALEYGIIDEILTA